MAAHRKHSCMYVPAAPLIELIERDRAAHPLRHGLHKKEGQAEFQLRYGVSYRSMHRWQACGLVNIYTADRICVRLGLTFWNVWPADVLAPTG